MKLNLDPPAPKAAPSALPILPSPYASPVRWWNVTTDGDCEGRSTRQLGEHYGHVAEIAFSLADKAMYDLKFSPSNNPVILQESPRYQAKACNVFVALNIDSKTWDMKHDKRAEWFRAWLDCEQIEVLPRSENAVYYAAVYLKLKPETL